MEKNIENNEATLSSPCYLRSGLLGKAIMFLSISLTCLIVLWSTAPYLATFFNLVLTTICLVLSTSNTKSLSLHGEEKQVEGRGPNMEKVTGHCDFVCHGEASHLEACEVEAIGFPSDRETTEFLGREIFHLGWSSPSNLGRILAVSESESLDFDGYEDYDLVEIYLPEGDPDGYTDESKLKLAEIVHRKDTIPVEISEDDIEKVNEDAA